MWLTSLTTSSSDETSVLRAALTITPDISKDKQLNALFPFLGSYKKTQSRKFQVKRSSDRTREFLRSQKELSVVPERSYGGETFSGLGEVAEQRKLRGVIKVLKVSEGENIECQNTF